MINNPEAFVQIHEQDDYYELIDTRNQLFKDIQEYESRKNSNPMNTPNTSTSHAFRAAGIAAEKIRSISPPEHANPARNPLYALSHPDSPNNSA